MNFVTLGTGTLFALLGFAALVLGALHFLRVRRKRQPVATLIFWQSAVASERARRLGGPPRHFWTLLLLILAASLLLLALAEPRSPEAPRRCLVLDAGVLACGNEAWMRERAEALGASDPEVSLLLAHGGSVECFPARSAMQPRREALLGLVAGDGLDDLEALIQRALALVRGPGEGRVVLLGARTPSGSLPLELDIERAPSAGTFPVAPEAAPPRPIHLQVDSALPRTAQAFLDLPLCQGPGPVVVLREGTAGLQLPEGEPRPHLLAGIGPELPLQFPLVDAACTHGLATDASWQVLLDVAGVPLVQWRQGERAAEIEVAPLLFSAGSALAEDAVFHAWCLHWFLGAGGGGRATLALVAGRAHCVRAGGVKPVIQGPEGALALSSDATPRVLITPTRAGAFAPDAGVAPALFVHWPEGEAATESVPLAPHSAGEVPWRWLALAALLLLCLDAWWHARGRTP